MSYSLLIKQIKFYLICGAISTSFDFILYYSLYKVNVNIDIAKGSSFLFATFISYYLNKHWTFDKKSKSYIEMANFYILHVISMVVDVSCNKLFVNLLGLLFTGHIRILLAFVLATSCSIIVNFTGQKFWVFKKV